jgi:sulfate permease, SulP family
VFEAQLPAVAADSHNSVVILRLRGRTDLDTTFIYVLRRYAESLGAVDSKLVIVSASDRVREQLEVAGVASIVGQRNIYTVMREWAPK